MPRAFTLNPMMKIGWVWSPVVLYAGLIFVFSSLTGDKVLNLWPHADKVYHLLEYTPLGFLLARALGARFSKRRVIAVLAILLASLYGLSDEVHQLFVPGRKFSLIDLSFDCLGSTLGALIFLKKWQK